MKRKRKNCLRILGIWNLDSVEEYKWPWKKVEK